MFVASASHLTFVQAVVMGAVQGLTELFPVSSLGHAVLIPALVGGSWARNLDVAAPTSPYLSFIVGLHIATALALLVFYWRDWVRILSGAGTSIRHRRIRTDSGRLFWLLIVASIPVAIVGVLVDKLLRTTVGRPLPAAVFLLINGGILLAGHLLHRRRRGRHLAEDAAGDVDTEVARIGAGRAIAVGAAQALALLPGISRSGVTIIAGERAGLSTRAAARFAFLLATPAILGAGILKLPDLLGPEGRGILPQVAVGSVVAFVCALGGIAFLDRYFAKSGVLPFAIYCLAAGAVCTAIFAVR